MSQPVANSRTIIFRKGHAAELKRKITILLRLFYSEVHTICSYAVGSTFPAMKINSRNVSIIAGSAHVVVHQIAPKGSKNISKRQQDRYIEPKAINKGSVQRSTGLSLDELISQYNVVKDVIDKLMAGVTREKYKNWVNPDI